MLVSGGAGTCAYRKQISNQRATIAPRNVPNGTRCRACTETRLPMNSHPGGPCLEWQGGGIAGEVEQCAEVEGEGNIRINK